MRGAEKKAGWRCKIAAPLAIMAVLLVSAFSTGSAALLAPAVLLALLMVYGILSVRWTAGTMRVTAELKERTVRRGERASLRLEASHACPLPVAPVRLRVRTSPAQPPLTLRLEGAGRKAQALTLPFGAAHVGTASPGVERCEVSDLFGLFTRWWTPEAQTEELLVLPLTFEVQPWGFAALDPGLGTMARASEDSDSPAGVRAWQPGDPLKKVHWKLSARRREVLVRRFEEPVLPETLVLMDCSRLPEDDHAERLAAVRDTMLETAASVVLSQQGSDREIRLPLYGEHPTEVSVRMGMPLVLESLARMDFSSNESPERMLLSASRRLRQVGATVVIAARLSGEMAEVMAQMRRMGPTMRLYLVTAEPEADHWQPQIARLQGAGVEVCYVRPGNL